MIDIKVKRLTETATIPTYGSDKAACADLYADCPNVTHGIYIKEDGVAIPPHTTVKVGTGLSFQPPKGYCGLIFARSGISTKKGLAPANKVGVCDEDYTGEYIVAVHNHSDYIQVIHHKDRIAQLMFVPYEQANFILVDELNETNRGNGGFGSSGT